MSLITDSTSIGVDELADVTTMRAGLIGHFEPCMTEIYLNIDARMAADYIRTQHGNVRWFASLICDLALRLPLDSMTAGLSVDSSSAWYMSYYGWVRISSSFAHQICR